MLLGGAIVPQFLFVSYAAGQKNEFLFDLFHFIRIFSLCLSFLYSARDALKTILACKTDEKISNWFTLFRFIHFPWRSILTISFLNFSLVSLYFAFLRILLLVFVRIFPSEIILFVWRVQERCVCAHSPDSK